MRAHVWSLDGPCGYSTPKWSAMSSVVSQPQFERRSIGFGFVIERVANTRAGSAVAVQRQELAGERVVDRVEATHRIHPPRDWCGGVVDLVQDIHVPGRAGLLVVLVAAHQRIPKNDVIRSTCFWSSSAGRQAP